MADFVKPPRDLFSRRARPVRDQGQGQPPSSQQAAPPKVDPLAPIRTLNDEQSVREQAQAVSRALYAMNNAASLAASDGIRRILENEVPRNVQGELVRQVQEQSRRAFVSYEGELPPEERVAFWAQNPSELASGALWNLREGVSEPLKLAQTAGDLKREQASADLEAGKGLELPPLTDIRISKFLRNGQPRFAIDMERAETAGSPDGSRREFSTRKSAVDYIKAVDVSGQAVSARYDNLTAVERESFAKTIRGNAQSFLVFTTQNDQRGEADGRLAWVIQTQKPDGSRLNEVFQAQGQALDSVAALVKDRPGISNNTDIYGLSPREHQSLDRALYGPVTGYQFSRSQDRPDSLVVTVDRAGIPSSSREFALSAEAMVHVSAIRSENPAAVNNTPADVFTNKERPEYERMAHGSASAIEVVKLYGAWIVHTEHENASVRWAAPSLESAAEYAGEVARLNPLLVDRTNTQDFTPQEREILEAGKHGEVVSWAVSPDFVIGEDQNPRWDLYVTREDGTTAIQSHPDFEDVTKAALAVRSEHPGATNKTELADPENRFALERAIHGPVTEYSVNQEADGRWAVSTKREDGTEQVIQSSKASQADAHLKAILDKDPEAKDSRLPEHRLALARASEREQVFIPTVETEAGVIQALISSTEGMSVRQQAEVLAKALEALGNEEGIEAAALLRRAVDEKNPSLGENPYQTMKLIEEKTFLAFSKHLDNVEVDRQRYEQSSLAVPRAQEIIRNTEVTAKQPELRTQSESDIASLRNAPPAAFSVEKQPGGGWAVNEQKTDVKTGGPVELSSYHRDLVEALDHVSDLAKTEPGIVDKTDRDLLSPAEQAALDRAVHGQIISYEVEKAVADGQERWTLTAQRNHGLGDTSTDIVREGSYADIQEHLRVAALDSTQAVDLTDRARLSKEELQGLDDLKLPGNSYAVSHMVGQDTWVVAYNRPGAEVDRTVENYDDITSAQAAVLRIVENDPGALNQSDRGRLQHNERYSFDSQIPGFREGPGAPMQGPAVDPLVRGPGAQQEPSYRLAERPEQADHRWSVNEVRIDPKSGAAVELATFHRDKNEALDRVADIARAHPEYSDRTDRGRMTASDQAQLDRAIYGPVSSYNIDKGPDGAQGQWRMAINRNLGDGNASHAQMIEGDHRAIREQVQILTRENVRARDLSDHSRFSEVENASLASAKFTGAVYKIEQDREGRYNVTHDLRAVGGEVTVQGYDYVKAAQTAVTKIVASDPTALNQSDRAHLQPADRSSFDAQIPGFRDGPQKQQGQGFAQDGSQVVSYSMTSLKNLDGKDEVVVQETRKDGSKETDYFLNAGQALDRVASVQSQAPGARNTTPDEVREDIAEMAKQEKEKANAPEYRTDRGRTFDPQEELRVLRKAIGTDGRSPEGAGEYLTERDLGRIERALRDPAEAVRGATGIVGPAGGGDEHNRHQAERSGVEGQGRSDDGHQQGKGRARELDLDIGE